MAEPARQMRSDAVRTRKLLLDAATEAFARHGTEVSVAEIAESAGIGKGTVFRHFPAKDDLLAAIVCQNMERMVATGERLLGEGDATAGLYELMTVAVELQVKDRAFCQVVHGALREHADVARDRKRLEAVTEALTRAAQDQGGIRGDITGADVILLMAGIYQTAAPMLDEQPDLWRRYLCLAFQSLQDVTAGPLPHPAPPW
ncbi:TetR/AcrR family transcriptional regulator [Nocardia tengchongensis]|uniref:TetR/AcrR family transcriptional regulator n=1 Tax=Nocardia tengchongensis TaxID=2055889 RepID=UPI00360E76BC